MIKHRLFLLQWLSISLLLSACGGNKLDEQQEMLERPPKIVDFSTYESMYPGSESSPEETASGEENRLENFDVVLTYEGGRNTTLAIVQPYDQSWQMVATALKHDAFDVDDKDRDAGIFYLGYDPDYEKSSWEKAGNFFTGGSETINDFELKLTDIDTITEISATMVTDEALDDEVTIDPDVEVEKFLLQLYQILRTQE